MNIFFDDYYERLNDIHQSIHSAIDNLPEEALNWKPNPSMNSISVLIVHLTGAERFLIGEMVGGDDALRNRDGEFVGDNWTLEALKTRLNKTLEHSRNVLAKLDLEDLTGEVYSQKHKRIFRKGWCLLHALEHNGLHLGHIQITKDMWEKFSTGG